MTDTGHAGAPNHPDVSIPFPRKMKGFLRASAALCAFVVACSPPPPPPPPQPQPSPTAGPFQMDASLTPDLVPPFKQGPLIAWGPEPEGVPHGERVRRYDLQHQSTTVRFDWAHHGVDGSTTLQIAGLTGASPISNVAIDAGDMTIKRVASGAQPLKHDYDGRSLVVHLASPLRAGAKTSITIVYGGANRSKGVYFKPRHIIWTQGEAEDTRYWVPTYDFPNDRTTWEFYVWRAKGERALSKGRLAGSGPRAGWSRRP